MKYSGHSGVQQNAEMEILRALARKLGFDLDKIQKMKIGGIALDGYIEDSIEPCCIEIWAHQGEAKTAQKYKLMHDACKLIPAEKRLGKKCRKIICVTDKSAISFLSGKGWQGSFFSEFDVKIEVVDIPETARREIVEAQKKQNMFREE